MIKFPAVLTIVKVPAAGYPAGVTTGGSREMCLEIITAGRRYSHPGITGVRTLVLYFISGGIFP